MFDVGALIGVALTVLAKGYRAARSNALAAAVVFFLASTLDSEAEKASAPKIPQKSHHSSSIPPELGTPYGGMRSASSQGSEHGYPTVRDHTSDIDPEFASCSYEDKRLADRASHNIATDDAIEEFIKKCGLYNRRTKQWKIPQNTTLSEGSVYGSYVDICNKVINYFGLSEKRVAIDTHGKNMSHKEIPDLSTCPDICFQALVPDTKTRDSFPYVDPDAAPSYRMTAAPFAIKTENTFSAKGNLTQIAVYARQIFRQQANRHLVNVLTGSPSEVRLYAFARDGVHYSSPVNIHKDPKTFVKFILGASSDKPEFVGFDQSIYWKNGERFIEMRDSETQATTTYRLENTEPVFDQRAIRGRGTCCWLVKSDGVLFIIKDAWRYIKRVAEWEFLQEVDGLDGVGQMKAFEDEISSISKLRGLPKRLPSHLKQVFRDRILSRMLLYCHGRSIETFQTRLQLLYAFRDAICGHQNLWNNNILHRDISINNILLGSDPLKEKNSGLLLHAFRDAICGHQNLWNNNILHRDISVNNILLGADPLKEKNLGLVIDLDLAIRIDRNESLYGLDFKTRTRAFQSINVLLSYNPAAGTTCKPHDYMDDLESFFYVLCWITCGFAGPGQKLVEFPDDLKQWESADPRNALRAKLSVITWVFDITYRATPYFGAVFDSLMAQLARFFADAHNRRALSKGKPVPTLMELKSTSSAAYNTVLGYVDEAIKAVESEPPETEGKHIPDPAQTPTVGNFAVPAVPPPGRRRQGKRRSDSVDDDDLSASSMKKRKHRYETRASQGSSLSTSYGTSEDIEE
ncbi:hypothetical protein HYPSUDRAFT_205456 [Hypholoma sublateritium FD-334 SS-4]|uniref:Fungal-type protein kinase domain-containing protein n=1 Tax=Hypholoma sublateritium (strain FD-334 SS-4) TaxID=945553 RepID=A0A0D2NNK1_HYPSF|nr:hypothetical protein HYPSUDRAFT_205456 [Hypholoma sublateritium FD-334 SS-4]